MESDKQKLKNSLERRMLLVRDSKDTQLYYQAVIDYHEYICNSEELKPILGKIIEKDLITPYYLKQVFNDFIISQNLKYDTVSELRFPNFYSKEIEAKYKLLKSFYELIKSEYDETKSLNQVRFSPNAPIIKTKRDEEFFYTQKLHNDIIENLETEQKNEDRHTEKELAFDSDKSILYFLDEAIVISNNAQSSAHDLLRPIFKDKPQLWNTDEIFDDWHYYLPDEKPPKNKVYQAGKAVNRIVAQDTKIKDFLDISTKTVSINKKYIQK